MREAGLAQARRSVEKNVVDGLAAALGGGDGDFQVVLGIFLTDKIVQGTRPEAVIQGRVFNAGFTGNYAGDGLPPQVYLP
jgi:hypothetical protein